jgi:hypothetical protein
MSGAFAGQWRIGGLTCLKFRFEVGVLHSFANVPEFIGDNTVTMSAKIPAR